MKKALGESLPFSTKFRTRSPPVTRNRRFYFKSIQLFRNLRGKLRKIRLLILNRKSEFGPQ